MEEEFEDAALALQQVVLPSERARQEKSTRQSARQPKSKFQSKKGDSTSAPKLFPRAVPSKLTSASCSVAGFDVASLRGPAPSVMSSASGPKKNPSECAKHLELVNISSILSGDAQKGCIYNAQRCVKAVERDHPGCEEVVLLRSHLDLASKAQDSPWGCGMQTWRGVCFLT